MGNPFKASKQKTTSTSEPWGPQGDALEKAYSEAGSIYDAAKGTPYYQGDLHASMDPLTTQGINANQSYATGAGAQAAGAVSGAAGGLLPAGQNAMGAYGNLATMAGKDPTQSNITSAGQYANNPYMDSMIDAASRDVNRNLYENELPGINTAATGSGNMNSSRAGVASGIAQRGAQDAIYDISAGLRGSAYDRGLNLAEDARVANMNGTATAGAGYGNLFGQGLSGSALGQDMTYKNNDALIQGGLMNQADAQGELNADFQSWQGQDQRSSDLLNRYYGIVGQPTGFGTTTGVQPGPSPFSQLAGAATSAAGAYMAFSDGRLKKNVEVLYTRPDGLDVIGFDYRDDNDLDLPTGRQIGVKAEQVAELRPDALAEPQFGFMRVDYGKL